MEIEELLAEVGIANRRKRYKSRHAEGFNEDMVREIFVGLDVDGDGLIDRKDLREWGRLAAATAAAAADEEAGYGIGGKFKPPKSQAEIVAEARALKVGTQGGGGAGES